MNNKDLILKLHESSQKYIVSRIEKHKDQQTFLIVWNECQSLIRNSINLLEDLKLLQWNYNMRSSKKFWLIKPKYELLAIENCLDVINSINNRFN